MHLKEYIVTEMAKYCQYYIDHGLTYQLICSWNCKYHKCEQTCKHNNKFLKRQIYLNCVNILSTSDQYAS